MINFLFPPTFIPTIPSSPTFDNRSNADLGCKGLVPVVRAVKLCAVFQGAKIVNRYGISRILLLVRCLLLHPGFVTVRSWLP